MVAILLLFGLAGSLTRILQESPPSADASFAKEDQQTLNEIKESFSLLEQQYGNCSFRLKGTPLSEKSQKLKVDLRIVCRLDSDPLDTLLPSTGFMFRLESRNEEEPNRIEFVLFRHDYSMRGTAIYGSDGRPVGAVTS